MADAVYAIEDFPDDDLLWRIEWIGGVGYNTCVPSDPQIVLDGRLEETFRDWYPDFRQNPPENEIQQAA